MDHEISTEIHKRLMEDFRFRKTRGKFLQEGQCPSCKEWEVYCHAERPAIIRCGRSNNCGEEWLVKERYADLFNQWSDRFKASEAKPNAAADAYLGHGRGLDLKGLSGCYSQDLFQDRNTGLTSATVRFPIVNGFWERLIDKPERFEKKAHFKYGTQYQGHWWAPPGADMVALAKADDIWIAEGIFDALSLRQAGLVAVSCMSTNNYPDQALGALRKAVIEGATPNKFPRIIWAFDVGRAGVEWGIKAVTRARKDGWTTTAAQVMPDGEGTKLDWNDCLQRGLLSEDHIPTYLYNGAITIAETPFEKARLIKDHTALRTFNFKHGNQSYWAKSALDEDQNPTIDVSRIANCAFRILYRERDELIDDTNYYLSIRFPNRKMHEVRARFSNGSLTSNGDFKKRLFAFGGMWSGTDNQLTHIIAQQSGDLRTVTPVDFLGYSPEHKGWVLGDVAVYEGRIIRKNVEDYFELGQSSVKLRTAERILSFPAKPPPHDYRWYQALATAFETKGIITLAFFTMTFFAEQIRAKNKSLGFLEMNGEPGTGKSTLLTFLWLLAGRNDNYEGFDPSKATPAAVARNFASISNLPVVLMEGDRQLNSESNTHKRIHAKSFDYDELKPLWNGTGLRERGRRNAGNETDHPPFRAAIIIEQNFPVNGALALLQRIMVMPFTAAHFNEDTKRAVAQLENWEPEAASTYMLEVIKREKPLLTLFFERYAFHLNALTNATEVRSERLLKNHAQLAAAIDMLSKIVPMSEMQRNACIAHIANMCVERNRAVSSDHPIVERFWEIYDWLVERETPAQQESNPLNCSRKDDTISINLYTFEERVRISNLAPIDRDDLLKHLKTSKMRKFLTTKTVNAPNGKMFHCWVFQRPTGTDRII